MNLLKRKSNLEETIDKYTPLSREEKHTQECNTIVKQTYFAIVFPPIIYFGGLFLVFYLESQKY